MITFYRYLSWVLLMALEKICDKNKYVDFQVVYQTTYLIKNELPFKILAVNKTYPKVHRVAFCPEYR